MNVAFNYGYWDLWRLYHKVTFDGANRIIYVNEGVTELNIKKDIYSDWKEWVKVNIDNATWAPAIRTIGGDPTVGIERAGDIYFLINNWKLYIDLTKVRVTGTLFSDNFDSAYYDYSGNIQYPVQVSSTVSTVETAAAVSASNIWDYSSRTLTQEIAADAPTTEEIATAVWGYITRTLTQSAGTTPQEVWEYGNRTLSSEYASEVAASVWESDYSLFDEDGTMGHLLNYSKQLYKQIWLDTTLSEDGNGSQESPYNNIASVSARAAQDNIRKVILKGDLTVSEDIENLIIEGIGRPLVVLNNHSISLSVFENVYLAGNYTNGSEATFKNCLLAPGFYLDGFIDTCSIYGEVICQNSNSIVLKNCYGISSVTPPTISMNGQAINNVIISGYTGDLIVKDCTHPSDKISVDMLSGSLTFHSSCTNGTMIARGLAAFTDNTSGATVINQMVNQETVGQVADVSELEAKVLEVWKLMGLDATNPKTITDTSITVNGITLTISQPDDNTTEVTRS